ncbi:hypothetical protein BB934_01985 [Microvirga ossetica]|uniref:Uncharacterized protein n=1 Tax=Microvirga ossetica TaxID=1882682 RepID=A0A1B2EB06_9HYPH|nr:hypothetical protein [Microvirga ossetica]ANY77139.1 hypothetical protein BB934_01985 [Microvirga ossetica]
MRFVYKRKLVDGDRHIVLIHAEDAIDANNRGLDLAAAAAISSLISPIFSLFWLYTSKPLSLEVRHCSGYSSIIQLHMLICPEAGTAEPAGWLVWASAGTALKGVKMCDHEILRERVIPHILHRRRVHPA